MIYLGLHAELMVLGFILLLMVFNLPELYCIDLYFKEAYEGFLAMPKRKL